MSSMELFLDGLKLMILGMGVVFSFLVVMIWLMKLMSKVLAPFANMFAPPPKAAPKAQNSDVELAAVAVASVELFRNK